MKEDNQAHKEKNDNYYLDYINNLISSPKQTEKEPILNLISSPEKSSMNQKFFPSKENYFGIKTSPKNNMGRPISPGSHSPILNYYAGLSPKGDSLGCYSPKNDNNNCNNSNIFSGKLSPNFNYSPSTIFNAQKSNKDIRSHIQNFSFNNNLNNNEDDYKTLQEKMAPFVGKTDVNNFFKIGSFPLNTNNLDDNKNEHQDEENEDDDDNEEAFTLRIDNFDEDFVSEEVKKKSTQSNESIQKKSSNEININNNLNNNNEQANQNINLQKPLNNQENQVKDSNDILPDKSLVKNIINKQEFKPYIPNKYRNIPQSINNIQNSIEGQIYPSYEGSNPVIDSQNYNEDNIHNMNPEKIGQYLNFRSNQLGMDNKNKFSLDSKNEYSKFRRNDYENENLYNNFYYNGDNYKISNFKEYKKRDYLKTGEIPSIGAADIVTAITANNKKIKRIDPNTYLNESIEYLSYNIFPLAKDQAGCRFLQEKLEKDPIKTTESFYKAILPFVLPLVKDPFGNYLIQKLFIYLSPEQIKKILEILSPTILDIGSNCHGTRVIQNLINYLSTEELVNCFLKTIKPYIIPLLKELNGTHIINKFINDHHECADEINKVIIDNCSLLATHRHGCCILQKMLEGPNKKLRNNLINSLIENCFVLIIDQFGNYVIQSILLLNDKSSSSAIAMKICDNLPYYSKHRYSSNVIEKCFDFCGKKEKKKLIEKICTPEIISELILDEHGNYVIQKALYYAEYKEKEIILNIIKPLIQQIKNTSFGEKLLYRLYSLYPQLNPNMYKSGDISLNEYVEFNNFYNNKNKEKENKRKGKKKKKNNQKNNKNNSNNNENNLDNRNDMINNNNNNEINNNVSLNNYYNINNNTINININSNNENNGTNKINLLDNNIVDNNAIQNTIDNISDNNNNKTEVKKKKKKKKGKKKKKIQQEFNNNNEDNKNDDNNDLNLNNNKNDDNNDLNLNKNKNDDKQNDGNNDLNLNNNKNNQDINQNNTENKEIEKNC